MAENFKTEMCPWTALSGTCSKDMHEQHKFPEAWRIKKGISKTNMLRRVDSRKVDGLNLPGFVSTPTVTL